MGKTKETLLMSVKGEKLSLFKTLSDLQKATEVADYSGDGEKVQKYFTVKDKEKFLIRFRQELVQDAPGYSEEIGTAQVIGVHTSPTNFKLSATCTADDEKYDYKCWACAQVGLPEIGGKWRKKNHLVVNIAVFYPDDDGGGTWEARVLDQKFTSAHVGQDIVNVASEFGSLLDNDFRFSRAGTGTKTQYNLMPLAVKEVDPAIAELPFHDLTRMFRTFAPAEQKGFYTAEEDGGAAEGWE